MSEIIKTLPAAQRPEPAPAPPFITVGFLPWWPGNPYQILLRRELNTLDVRVVGNPQMNLFRFLLNRDGLDVLHIHWPAALYTEAPWKLPFILAGLLLARLRKNNIIWTIHELEFYDEKFPLLNRIMLSVLRKLCAAHILHSAESEHDARTKGLINGPTTRVLHPAYTGYYKDDVTKSEARLHLSLSESARVYLFFGYVKPYKGVEELISAFRAVAGKDDILLIAGRALNDEIKGRIEHLADGEPRIRLNLGYIPDDEVQLYFRAADIVVFPFRKTHTSGSVMLAMTFGKPFIAPAIGSIPEYVDASMAELFDPSRPDGLREAISRVGVRDLEAMGDAAKRHAAGFRWDAMGAAHVRAYCQILRRAPPPSSARKA